MTRALAVVGIIVVHAVAQALTVLGDPVPVATPGFAASFALSLALLTVAAWAGATLVLRAPWRWAGLVWMLGLVVITTGVSILSPFATPLPLLVGLVIVPSVIAGAGPLGGLRSFRRHPVRHAFGLLGALALIVVGWAAAFALGLFVTGFVAVVATWVVLGALGALVVAGWRERPGHPDGTAFAADGIRTALR